ncbi:hypothetical protein E6C70_08455 [Glaciibacter flavus]|uniref:Uncharacterized protein n=1 Tax=Orlajensenia flava TaxID=2565934 RepID=A0A4S4FVG8_9MICO|nr:hypothetical protein [Glaciibacter flavus]THG34308.1 hypothetical protein E6C70_08455 [Glaciibacter flavus]
MVERTAPLETLYAAEIAGAVVFISGSTVGLYIACAAMTLNACYMITGAWLLVVRLFQDKTDATSG